MKLTPQERLALGVTALLLAAGGAVRYARPAAPAAAWADSLLAAPADVSGQRGRVRAATAAEERSAEPLAPGERLNPNTASAAELDRLPKVGPALAERIVARRASHGRYRSLADIDSVAGVGPALLQAIAPHLELPAAPAARRRAPSALLQRATPPADALVSPLDLNTASAAELEALPGVGPALAARIVARREAGHRFRSLADLDSVPGIGPHLLQRLRPHVRLQP